MNEAPLSLSRDDPDRLPEQVLVLEPGRAERHYWRDLWRYRELFGILAWRDVSVRYKQTAIGLAWALLRPFITMVIFTAVFGRLARLPNPGGAPYPVMVFAGMLAWFLFSSILSDGPAGMIASSNLVNKVYFPRIIIPSATAAVALVDLGINLLMMAGLMAWYRFMPSWHVVLLPIFIVLAVSASLGPALLLTALNVKYRDFRYIIPFIVQFGIYVSPVGFSSAIVPARWRFWFGLNPVVAPIDGFRWCLLGHGNSLDPVQLVTSVIVNGLFLWIGIAYFRATERGFADVI